MSVAPSARRVPASMALVAGLALAAVACGSSATTSSTPTTAPGSTAPATTAPGSTAPATSAPATGTSGTPTGTGVAASMRTQRYCEVLLVTVTGGDATARVFNSYPMNDCPEARWQALDAKAIAAEHGVTLAVLNGPRYWLMDEIEAPTGGELTRETFGGIEMVQRATVDVGPIAEAMKPYTPHAVDRRTVFTFDAGRTVYELTDPTGATYVMQTWSQQKDPSLGEADLAGLGSRLALPDGWTYTTRTLDAPLEVVTTTETAKVLQDDLGNSYSLVPNA